jgi:photosystem II stability/assembly factor-like uncharacterized protein
VIVTGSILSRMRATRHSVWAAIFVAGAFFATAGCSRTPPSAWEALPLGTNADFRDVWFADADHGWIVGGSFQIPGGIVGRTADGGKTWRFKSDVLGPGSRLSVQAVHFFDAERGLIATDTGSILSTTDGGENWARVSRRGRDDGVARMFFLDDRNGWTAGLGPVLRTSDAGQEWTPASTDEAGDRTPARAVHFVDERNGWVAGMQASLLRTRDAGATWEPVAVPIVQGEHPSFWDVFFIDNEFGWVVGEEGTILSTQDGGSSWTLRSTGLADARSVPKLERIPQAGGKVAVIDAGDRTPGFAVSAVRFLDRNRGWVTGYYPNFGRSLILRTGDGGATWSVDADIAGEELRALFVEGRDSMWAVGARVREGPQSIYRRKPSAK